MQPDLTTTVGPLRLRSPLLAAAGTVGYGVEFAAQLRSEHIGAIVLKTVTRHAREGHPPPRLVDTPSGMLNCVGLQNVGLQALVREKWPAIQQLGVPVILSVLGETLEDWEELARQAQMCTGLAAVELNLSCPNLATDTATAPQPELTAHDPAATQRVVERVRAQLTHVPLLAKLSPDVTDIVSIVAAATRGGADAVVIGNTFRGMAIDPATRRSRLSQPTGGLSGPAIRPLMVRRVWEAAQHTQTPIVGAGGIMCAEDALEYLLAGACAVEVGTAHFVDPKILRRMATGLTAYLTQHRMTRIDALIGSLQ